MYILQCFVHVHCTYMYICVIQVLACKIHSSVELKCSSIHTCTCSLMNIDMIKKCKLPLCDVSSHCGPLNQATCVVMKQKVKSARVTLLTVNECHQESLVEKCKRNNLCKSVKKIAL